MGPARLAGSPAAESDRSPVLRYGCRMTSAKTCPRGRFSLFCTLPALLLVVSCDGDPDDGPAGDPVAVEPQAFDLKMPEDFFAADGRGLVDSPDITDCHTQSVVVAGDDLLMTCVLYDHRLPEQRTLVGRSYVLKAPLCDVVGCDGPPAATVSWQVEELLGEAPEAESHRITRLLLQKEQLTAQELAIRHRMTHPAGLVYDAERGGVWMANAVYTSDSYAALLLIRPEAIGTGDRAALVAREIRVNDHVGALSMLGSRYLVALTWGGRRFIVIDLENGDQQAVVQNPFLGTEHEMGLQDCDRWNETTILCGGTFRYWASQDMPEVPLTEEERMDPARNPVFVRKGRLQQLRFDVTRFPDVEVEVAGYLMGALSPEAEPSMDLGRSMLRTNPDGSQDYLLENDYGEYQLHLPLPYEAVGFDPDMEHVYFVPQDLPAGRMIRMTLAR